MFRHAGYLVDALAERFETASTREFALLALAITLSAWFFTKYYGPDP